jgi:hypothetical protein
MSPRRVIWSGILAIGVAMIVFPVALSLPGKLSAGEKLINNFRPVMQPAAVARSVAYYNQTFVPLRPVAGAAQQAATEVPQLTGALAKQLRISPAGVQQFLGKQFPATSRLLQGLGQLSGVFAGVPPGLVHYRPLVAMRSNVTNYEKIASLPDFRLFTWFLIAPGLLIALLSGWGLVSEGRRERAPVPVLAT